MELLCVVIVALILPPGFVKTIFLAVGFLMLGWLFWSGVGVMLLLLFGVVFAGLLFVPALRKWQDRHTPGWDQTRRRKPPR